MKPVVFQNYSVVYIHEDSLSMNAYFLMQTLNNLNFQLSFQCVNPIVTIFTEQLQSHDT